MAGLISTPLGRFTGSDGGTGAGLGLAEDADDLDRINGFDCVTRTAAKRPRQMPPTEIGSGSSTSESDVKTTVSAASESSASELS